MALSVRVDMCLANAVAVTSCMELWRFCCIGKIHVGAVWFQALASHWCMCVAISVTGVSSTEV